LGPFLDSAACLAPTQKKTFRCAQVARSLANSESRSQHYAVQYEPLTTARKPPRSVGAVSGGWKGSVRLERRDTRGSFRVRRRVQGIDSSLPFSRPLPFLCCRSNICPLVLFQAAGCRKNTKTALSADLPPHPPVSLTSRRDHAAHDAQGIRPALSAHPCVGEGKGRREAGGMRSQGVKAGKARRRG